jgi:hypothetical protein
MRRVAGVVERGGLENRCTPRVPRVRIPDSPPFYDLSYLLASNYKTEKMSKCDQSDQNVDTFFIK